MLRRKPGDEPPSECFAGEVGQHPDGKRLPVHLVFRHGSAVHGQVVAGNGQLRCDSGEVLERRCLHRENSWTLGRVGELECERTIHGRDPEIAIPLTLQKLGATFDPKDPPGDIDSLLDGDRRHRMLEKSV